MNQVCINGKIVPADKPVLMPGNRGFRYGDALFETMKLVAGKIVLEKYHFERLFKGLRLLQFDIPSLITPSKLSSEIGKLCRKNQCVDLARVRLSVFRGNGGLSDEEEALQYLVECRPADKALNGINKTGFKIDIYPGARKSQDIFGNLKSANFLPYVMAARYARTKKLNDCLVTNTRGNIADASIANIFLVKKNMVITPALTEGCVEGVMRRYLLEKLRGAGSFEMREGVITKNDLETFDEVFLTNALYGMRWVKKFRNKTYSNIQTLKIYAEYITPLST